MLKRISHLIFITFLTILLFACGGGGGGGAPAADDGAGSPPANNTNTDWDQLIWDQDNWR